MKPTIIPQDVADLFHALALESAVEAMRKGNLSLAMALVDSIEKAKG